MITPRLHLQYPVNGVPVRLKIVGANVLRDDAVRFVLEDGREFLMSGEVLGNFGSLLPQMDTIYLSAAPTWLQTSQ